MKGRRLFWVFLLSLILACSGCQADNMVSSTDNVVLPYYLSAEPAFYEDLCPLTDFKGIDVEYVKSEDGYYIYELVNCGKQAFEYGEEQYLNVLVDGDWYQINHDPEEIREDEILVFTDMADAIEPGMSRMIKGSMRLLGIDDLVPGEYRLVLQGGWRNRGMQCVYVPFTIE